VGSCLHCSGRRWIFFFSPITRWKLWKNAERFGVCVFLSFDTASTELKLDQTSLTVESTDLLKWQVFFQVRRNRPSARNSMYLLRWQSWRSFSSRSYLKAYKLCSFLSPWLRSKWFSPVTSIFPTPPSFLHSTQMSVRFDALTFILLWPGLSASEPRSATSSRLLLKTIFGKTNNSSTCVRYCLFYCFDISDAGILQLPPLTCSRKNSVKPHFSATLT
jgi:hypothetical protein